MTRIIGTAGADFLEGGPGIDQIFGRGGSDELRGLDGDDILNGGAGADVLRGGPGHDVLIGGAGGDELHGSTGEDVFVYNSASDSTAAARDRIRTFDFGNPNSGDKIDLSNVGSFVWGDTLWAVNSATNLDTIIMCNTDGDPQAELQIAVADGASWNAGDWIPGDFIL